MPLNDYFDGSGEKVMKSMKKAHPNYSDKRIKAEFYATANKHKKSTNKGRTVETYEN